jgi:hypothetical protein
VELNARREEMIRKHWEQWAARLNTGAGKGKRENDGKRHNENTGAMVDGKATQIGRTECWERGNNQRTLGTLG